MPKSITRAFEALLLVIVLSTVALGATWMGGSPINLTAQTLLPGAPDASAQPAVAAAPLPLAQTTAAPVDAAVSPTSLPGVTATPTGTPGPGVTSTPGAVNAQTIAAPSAFNGNISADQLDANDAPLLQQAPGTINIMLLGSDASADARYARTDSLIVASINPDLPSVSMLSIPRDTHVRIPGFGTDRMNTAYERGYISNYAGGGPAFLALVLRKNFGIRIDHFVRIDFQGFIKAIDTLDGVEVLAECELHDTFPDKTVAAGKSDLDVYPGKFKLSGKQALWYSRSRWSTSDFDRARRQQKVLRAVFRKAKNSNLLQNALGLYGDFRENIETDLGLGDIPALVDIARRLDDITIKNRVITFPVVKTLKRADGALVLEPQPGILSYVAEALSPPAFNRAQQRVGVEVYNGSGRKDMEQLAAERLTWEGFLVVGTGTTDDRFPESQIIDYSTTNKGSAIPRLSSIFGIKRNNVIGQSDPSSPSAARIVLGEDYNSCPNTYNLAADVAVVSAGGKQIPTPTP